MQQVQTEDHQEFLMKWHYEQCANWSEIYNSELNDNISNDHCGYIWDGILCWPPTAAGEMPSLPCPYYIGGFFAQEVATKYCMQNGTWHNWTNFGNCHDGTATMYVHVSDYNATQIQRALFPVVKAISHIGYGVSEIMLVIAFFILATFKRLRCPRNMLHLHLFVSFIMKAFMGFLKASLFEQGLGLRSDFVNNNGTNLFHDETEGNWECKLITSLWQYFIMANYSWILMEGLYIHNLIMWALSADGNSILIYILLGWGLPLLFIPCWAIARLFWDNEYCWTVNNKHPAIFYIIQIPITVSILINFALFVNIVRLLLGKVQTSILEENERYWRLAKSTLILVALFGVPNFALLGLSFGSEEVQVVWLLCDQLFASFQGFFVSLLYCFLNSEVQEEIKKKWKRFAYNGRVNDNAFPTTSFASWSSSYSMHRAPCSFFRFCRLCSHSLKSRHRSESRASKRTETVDCIVCDPCPMNSFEMAKSTSPRHKEESCGEIGVEMSLLPKSQEF